MEAHYIQVFLTALTQTQGSGGADKPVCTANRMTFIFIAKKKLAHGITISCLSHQAG